MAEATQAHSNKNHGGKNEMRNEIRDGVREFGNRLNEKASEKANEYGEKGGELADRLPEMVRTAQDKVANTVEQVASVATDKAGQAAHWLKEKADTAFEGSDQALSSTRNFVRRYPVRTLACGVAVGAIVGWFLSNRGREAA